MVTAVLTATTIRAVALDEMGERLERCRETLGWSLGEVSARAGLKSRSHYGKLINERGTGGAKRKILDAVVAPFVDEGFSRVWLLTGEGDPGRELIEPEKPLPKDWIPPVAADVIQQLIEQGYPVDRVIPVVKGMSFDHKDPPTHLNVYKEAAAKLALTSAGKPQLQAEPSVDPSAKTTKEKAAAREKRAARSREDKGDE